MHVQLGKIGGNSHIVCPNQHIVLSLGITLPLFLDLNCGVDVILFVLARIWCISLSKVDINFS